MGETSFYFLARLASVKVLIGDRTVFWQWEGLAASWIRDPKGACFHKRFTNGGWRASMSTDRRWGRVRLEDTATSVSTGSWGTRAVWVLNHGNSGQKGLAEEEPEGV